MDFLQGSRLQEELPGKCADLPFQLAEMSGLERVGAHQDPARGAQMEVGEPAIRQPPGELHSAGDRAAVQPQSGQFGQTEFLEAGCGDGEEVMRLADQMALDSFFERRMMGGGHDGCEFLRFLARITAGAFSSCSCLSCSRMMAAITIVPPAICSGAMDSPRKINERTPATIGSMVEVMLARVARMRLMPS